MFKIIAVKLFVLCVGLIGVASAAELNASAQLPVEYATVEGVVKSWGGESDIYYLQSTQIGKVFLETMESNSGIYSQIRESEGQYVRVSGSWAEGVDNKLILYVDRLVVYNPSSIYKNMSVQPSVQDGIYSKSSGGLTCIHNKKNNKSPLYTCDIDLSPNYELIYNTLSVKEVVTTPSGIMGGQTTQKSVGGLVCTKSKPVTPTSVPSFKCQLF